MSELYLKVTSYEDLSPTSARLNVKKSDDNEAILKNVLPDQAYTLIRITDNNVSETKFHDCKIVAKEFDKMDGDFKVHPVVITYVIKE